MNVFVVSLFSYVCLFFVMPHEIWITIKEAIRRAITPYHGGAYPYEALVCGGLLFGLKPALRDPWAAGVSLLAVRSSNFPDPSNPHPPYVNLNHNMFIIAHRNGAAHDLSMLCEGPHKRESPKVYQSVIKGYFLPIANSKWNDKLQKHVPSPTPLLPTISTNLLAVRSLPAYLSAFFLSFLSNALPTSRRRRHALGISKDQVPDCLLCGKGEDSIAHIYSQCEVATAASPIFFSLVSLPLSSAPTSLAAFFLSQPIIDGIRPKVSAAVVSLSFALWNFRSKASAPRAELGLHWVIRRVVNLSFSTFLSFHSSASPKTKNRAEATERALQFIGSLSPLSIACYTDGSASPNPGPSGAGTHIIFPYLEEAAGLFVDAGTPLGPGTNNLGELWAIGITLFIVSKHPRLNDFHEVCIFTDSNYAIATLQGKGKLSFHSSTRALISSLLTRLRTILPVRLVWVPGHSGIFGNERADTISNIFSKLSSDPSTHNPFSSPSLSLSSSLYVSSSPLSDSPSPPFSTFPISSSLVKADKTDAALGIFPNGLEAYATSTADHASPTIPSHASPVQSRETMTTSARRSHLPHCDPLPTPAIIVPQTGVGAKFPGETTRCRTGAAAESIGILTINPGVFGADSVSDSSSTTSLLLPSPRPLTNNSPPQTSRKRHYVSSTVTGTPTTRKISAHKHYTQSKIDSFANHFVPLEHVTTYDTWDPGID